MKLMDNTPIECPGNMFHWKKNVGILYLLNGNLDNMTNNVFIFSNIATLKTVYFLLTIFYEKLFYLKSCLYPDKNPGKVL